MHLLLSLLLAATIAKPRLAFLDLTPGAGVSKELAQATGELLVVALSETGKFDVITRGDVKAVLGYEAQAQLLGCSESSCMVDLGGALGAAYLVNGSLQRLGGQLQLVLSLIDVAKATVARRVAQAALDESSLGQAAREAVGKLTGEVMASEGSPDACPSPPCTREAIAALKRWWEKNWDALTIVGVMPNGPYDQFLHEHIPARQFALIVRTRARDGSRSDYFATIRFKKVEGDWYFDEGGMRFLRSLPIVADEPPEEGALQHLLSDGFSTAHQSAKVQKLAVDRFPSYDIQEHSWKYRFDVTYKAGGKTQICPRAEAKIVHDAPGKPWKYLGVTDFNCEEVLDAN